jgi:hypothetical protein
MNAALGLSMACLCSALSACALRGPALTGDARLEYNEAVQRSNREELLLNVVRLRYLEGPEFLSVGSIASQMSFDVGATLGGTFGDDQSVPTRLVAPGGSFGYSEQPVTTFTPRQDEAFMRRLVEPIALDTLVALTRYGWSLERALLVVVEQANGVRNVATREVPAAADATAGERFAELARSLQALYERRWLAIDEVEEWRSASAGIPAERVTANDHLNAAAGGYRLEYVQERSAYVLQQPARRYVLRVAAAAQGSAELAAMLAGLELPPGQTTYELTADAPDGAGAVTVRTRSLMGALAYLSQGVAVPAADLATARAQPAPLEIPVPLRIASAADEPASAAVAVRHAGRWFYIEAADFDSRRTFGVLESLVRLQVGAGGAPDGPVLTLPIAR